MRRSMGALILTTFLALGPMNQAVAGDTVPLTLDDAINRAMTTNHHIQSLQAGTEAMAGLAESEKNRWLGELMFNGGVALHDQNTLIRPITQEMMLAGPATMPFDDRYAFWKIDYRIPVYGGGSVKGSRESARLSASASSKATQRAILGIRHQILVTYVGILSLDAQIDAWQDQKKALDSLLAHIKLGREAGKYSRVDLLKTQVEQQNVAMKVQALALGRDTVYASLMALLGEDPRSGVTYELVAVAGASMEYSQGSAAALVDSALANRGDLKAMKDAAAAQRMNASAVRGSRLPQVNLGGNLSGAHGGSIDFDDTYWSINATVSIPLFDMGRRKGLTDKANLTARSAELDVLDLQTAIRAEVAAAVAAVANAENTITTQTLTVELADEINRLERLRYDSGRGDIDNLLNSQSGRSLAEAALAEAHHDLLIALNNLQLTIEGECR